MGLLQHLIHEELSTTVLHLTRKPTQQCQRLDAKTQTILSGCSCAYSSGRRALLGLLLRRLPRPQAGALGQDLVRLLRGRPPGRLRVQALHDQVCHGLRALIRNGEGPVLPRARRRLTCAGQASSGVKWMPACFKTCNRQKEVSSEFILRSGHVVLGVAPVQISHKTTPKENMSLAAVHLPLSSCSGDAHMKDAPV